MRKSAEKLYKFPEILQNQGQPTRSVHHKVFLLVARLRYGVNEHFLPKMLDSFIAATPNQNFAVLRMLEAILKAQMYFENDIHIDFDIEWFIFTTLHVAME